MEINTPCPQCQKSPTQKMELLDGVIFLCPHCGHQEAESDSLSDYQQQILNAVIDGDDDIPW